MSLTFDTKEFDAAVASVARGSVGTDREIVTLSARELIFKIVTNTPKRTGNARAGWFPAWLGIGRSGSPKTRRKFGTNIIKGREYIADGTFEDNRNRVGEPSVSFSNKSRVRNPGKGRQFIDYIFLADQRRGFMARSAEQVADFFDRLSFEKYNKLLRRFGSR